MKLLCFCCTATVEYRSIANKLYFKNDVLSSAMADSGSISPVFICHNICISDRGICYATKELRIQGR